mmetsp:Transcript_147728/g.269370  ORF Transcript_147728/g.269370 Transcript_147728/m.269370 type:complete len:117 (+) Transcript_147728:313-663(+)
MVQPTGSPVSSCVPQHLTPMEDYARMLENQVWAYYNVQQARCRQHNDVDTEDDGGKFESDGKEASSNVSVFGSGFVIGKASSSSVGQIFATSFLVASTATATGLLYAYAKGRGKGS